MKCPIDKTEMEKGEMNTQSFAVTWRPVNSSVWSKGVGDGLKSIAWYCPKCGKIELTAELDKKERNG